MIVFIKHDRFDVGQKIEQASICVIDRTFDACASIQKRTR